MARQLIYDTPEKRKAAHRDNTRRYRAKLLAGHNPEQRAKVLAQARAYSAQNRKRPERQAYMKEYLKEYYQNNRDKYWRYRGITIDPQVYDQMSVDQNNRCAICFREEKKGKALAADHDHQSGRIRGLLCYKCNLAIGLLGDDPEIVLQASVYLRKVST